MDRGRGGKKRVPVTAEVWDILTRLAGETNPAVLPAGGSEKLKTGRNRTWVFSEREPEKEVVTR